jgi:serine/threonine-protein kinase
LPSFAEQEAMLHRPDNPPGMPTVIAGKYEMLDMLGQGGMGTVYRVRHVELDEIRALKVLPDHLAEDEERVGRFRREAQKMARFRHENIVRVYDFGRDRDLFYLVLDYVDGWTLAQLLRERGRLPTLQALDIARQVAAALAYAHAAGVTHRDVKGRRRDNPGKST